MNFHSLMKKTGKKTKQNKYLKKFNSVQNYIEFDTCHGNIKMINKMFAENEETAAPYGGGGIPCSSEV